jgi:hypothetical protein
MATREEIERLKRSWVADNCWDLEDTDGFEEHREELLAFSTAKEAEWEANRVARLMKKAEELGVPGNVALAQHVFLLEYRLSKLEEWAREYKQPVQFY